MQLAFEDMSKVVAAKIGELVRDPGFDVTE